MPDRRLDTHGDTCGGQLLHVERDPISSRKPLLLVVRCRVVHPPYIPIPANADQNRGEDLHEARDRTDQETITAFPRATLLTFIEA